MKQIRDPRNRLKLLWTLDIMTELTTSNPCNSYFSVSPNWPIALARTLGTMLRRNGDAGHLGLISDARHLTVAYDVFCGFYFKIDINDQIK